MTLIEYIRDYYSIKDRIDEIKMNPIQRVMDNDSLPYDDIMFIDGQWQKTVEISDGEHWAVMDLLSYTEDDIKKLVPQAQEAYKIYMSLVHVEDFDIQQIMQLSRQYRLNKEKGENLLCTD